MRSRLTGALFLGAVMLTACGGGSGGEADGTTIDGTDVVVEMYDNRFQYTEIRIPVGGSVNWVGAGRNPHNAVEAEERWSTESVFGSLDQLDGDEAMLTYNANGRYVFFCTFHGNAEGAGMAGVLIVGDG